MTVFRRSDKTTLALYPIEVNLRLLEALWYILSKMMF